MAAEQDDVNTPMIALVGTNSAILLYIIVTGLQDWYYNYYYHEINEKVVSQAPAELGNVVAKQQEILNSYGWVDKEKGLVHVPVDMAMKWVASGQGLYYPPTQSATDTVTGATGQMQQPAPATVDSSTEALWNSQTGAQDSTEPTVAPMEQSTEPTSSQNPQPIDTQPAPSTVEQATQTENPQSAPPQ